MASLLTAYCGVCRTHNRKERSHVLPGQFRPMADNDHAPSVAFEQAPGHGVGAVELWDGAGPLVRPDRGQSVMLAAGMQRKEHTVRQQLREWYYDAQRKRGTKRQALHVETCFAPLLGWVVSGWQGTQLALALDATTLGPALCGPGGQCGLSGLCDPRGLGHPARGRQARLAPRVAAPVAPAAARHPPRLDGDRAGRSRLVCPVAVSAHHAAGLASVFAHQHGRHLSAGRGAPAGAP